MARRITTCDESLLSKSLSFWTGSLTLWQVAATTTGFWTQGSYCHGVLKWVTTFIKDYHLIFVFLFPWTMFPWHFGRVHLPLYIVVTTTGSLPPRWCCYVTLDWFTLWIRDCCHYYWHPPLDITTRFVTCIARKCKHGISGRTPV